MCYVDISELKFFLVYVFYKVIFFNFGVFLQNWYNEVQKWLSGKINCFVIDFGVKKEIDR